MRMTFSVLISNIDDHFSNHGFLWEKNKGLRLSPLYDVNPVYNSSGSLRSCIDYDNSTASVSLLLEVAGYFGLDDNRAKEQIKNIAEIVVNWRNYAKKRNAPRKVIELITRAFEHDELQIALSF
jgi:serine/threonine-protein kinase HipA